MSDEFDSVRVVPKRAAIKLCNLSERTWERLPDPPPKTRLSEGRIGYRISDLKDWLDRRRVQP